MTSGLLVPTIVQAWPVTVLVAPAAPLSPIRPRTLATAATTIEDATTATLLI